jgi:hypothetical protein
MDYVEKDGPKHHAIELFFATPADEEGNNTNVLGVVS